MQVGEQARQHRPQRRARRRLARDRCPAPPSTASAARRQQAAHFAAQGVIAGAYDVVVAAGVEVMTRVPMGASMADGKYGFPFGPKVGARYAAGRRPRAPGHLGRDDRRQVGPRPARSSTPSACAVAAAAPRGPATRAASRARSCRCSAPTGELMIDRRGHPRDRRSRSLAKLKPVVRTRRTARSRPATRSQITDGAAALLIMSEEKAAALGLHAAGPLRRTFALAGVDPRLMLTGPIPATDEGARAGRHDARRHRPGRDQRGLRLGRAGLGEGAPPRHGARSTSTAAPSPSVTRSAARAPGS